jgi:hypothetical protein
MTELRCKDCGDRTEHLIYKQNLYKYKGERVRSCKKCGKLRTENNEYVSEREMIHLPSQKKVKNIED